MTACGEYIFTRYVADLDRFRNAYARVLGRDPADLPTRAPKLVHVLEGHSEGIARAIDVAGIEDPLSFLIVLFLEGTVTAGVHAYDSGRHARYRAALPYEVMIEHYPNLTVRHPQSVLVAHSPWTSEDLRLLEECAAKLAARWAVVYDDLIAKEEGVGLRILDALAHDSDLGWGAGSEVPEQVASSYMRGLRRAATS
jgi:hypothetical protein